MSMAAVLAAVAALMVSAGPVGRRLPPRTSAVVLTGAAVGSALSWLCVLGVLAAPLVLAAPAVRALVGLPTTGVQVHHALPVAISAIATAALAATLLSMAVVAKRRWPAALDLWRLSRQQTARTVDGLAVVRSDQAFAVALPGYPGRIVVSSAMVGALDAEERRVLLAHERCHLRSGHYLFRWATRLAAAVFPPARRLVADCDFALERWADEQAAVAVRDRRVAARALVHAALAAAAPVGTALAFPSSTVTLRVAALAAPPPRMRWWSLSFFGLVALTAAWAGQSVVHHTHILVAVAARVSSRP
jgi:beta-lactamase regulating signal transducer with metallopeptidase domain